MDDQVKVRLTQGFNEVWKLSDGGSKVYISEKTLARWRHVEDLYEQVQAEMTAAIADEYQASL